MATELLGRTTVVAALIQDPSGERRYLVQRRPLGKSRPLLWEFPGGKVEAGESDEQALLRECREELGVQLRVGQRLGCWVHRYPDTAVELRLYRAEIVEGRPTALEAEELGYLSPDQMRALSFCEADLPLLDELWAGRL